MSENIIKGRELQNMTIKDYDFAGWVTKNDIRCVDGVTIKHDAFKANDGQKVPLVWNHDYSSPDNVLGHVILKNQNDGVYGYGFFNETQEGKNAKELVKHGDISSMSIGARKIKRSGSNIIHGLIYEVSLVMSGANPGARIETSVQHSEDGSENEEGIVYPGTLIHSHDDILTHEEEVITHKNEGGTDVADESKDTTIGDIIDGMSEEQKNAVYALVGMVAEDTDEDDDDEGNEDELKQNVFNQSHKNENEVLLHNVNEAIKLAMDSKASSLKEVFENYDTGNDGGDTLTHGINSIEMLFPEAAHPTNGNTPILYKDPNTAYKRILNGVRKSPFSRVKTTVADLTEEEARAKGYIKGRYKKEEFFSLIKRETGPATVYKKQKIDRDDVIDITDFDVVSFMSREMRMMLEEEIARAVLVGDGRDVTDEDKIDETKIRPIVSDHEFFTIKETYPNAAGFIEAVIKAMAEYRGSGQPDMFIDPTLLADVKLVKGTDGRFLFGDIPSTAAIAAKLGINEIIPTSFMTDRGALIVNLNDYTLGASKGGEITNFNDFDIDFNQYKYLIETRLSGSLTLPKSAIYMKQGTKGDSANDEQAGMTWGERQEDKTSPGDEGGTGL